MTTGSETVDLDHVTLLYCSESSQYYEQPLNDLTSAGTLIDPETGDDLDLVAAVIAVNKRTLDATYDAIVQIIDRVKSDEPSLDTDEYVGMIMDAVRKAQLDTDCPDGHSHPA